PAQPIPAAPIPAQPIPAEAIATEPVPAQPVPPAPVAAEPAAPPMLGAILDDATVPKDTDSAFATLFALWGAEFSLDAGPPCEQAQRQLLLRCLYQRGTLSHLRRVNRPAILSLVGDDGREAQMVLSRLADESATLMAGDRKYSIDVDDLAEFWYGDYLVLWQPGHGSGSTLGPGSSGEGVIWLRQALAQIGGEAVPARPSDYYDSALEARVRDYQRERRLAVDGIAGTQTQIVISNELAAPGTPLLSEGH
ncbi:MAG TPA: peptidoglycan-binding domain-containing protein, partial [Gammaproteobacteria bacterium]|nr:peptidoglycan-binding domain-containing protein [Gammaproteobacteria bacterium]